MAERVIDLEALTLFSGQAVAVELEISSGAPVLGGEQLALDPDPASVRIDVSRTTSGFALRLRSEVTVSGRCARCLEPARLVLDVDAREVDQAEVDEEGELASPYVSDELLDPETWLHDAIALALPERLLCRPDCAGLCEVCGISLNDIEPGSHTHERPLDPRFAKLRDLGDELPK
jgi:DUF177 domain-containing protein